MSTACFCPAHATLYGCLHTHCLLWLAALLVDSMWICQTGFACTVLLGLLQMNCMLFLSNLLYSLWGNSAHLVYIWQLTLWNRFSTEGPHASFQFWTWLSWFPWGQIRFLWSPWMRLIAQGLLSNQQVRLCHGEGVAGLGSRFNWCILWNHAKCCQIQSTWHLAMFFCQALRIWTKIRGALQQLPQMALYTYQAVNSQMNLLHLYQLKLGRHQVCRMQVWARCSKLVFIIADG